MYRYWLILAALLLTCSCTTAKYQTKKSPKRFNYQPLTITQKERLVQSAESFIGKTSLIVNKRVFRADCSGFIRAAFAKAQLPLGGVMKANSDNDVKTIYRYIKKYGQVITSNKPMPGDIVFFHNTYDRSRNGLMNDALTHIGIVIKINHNVVHFVHHLGQSIILSRMDLSNAQLSFDPHTNERINHILRRAQGPYKSYTAAELFAGFGRL